MKDYFSRQGSLFLKCGVGLVVLGLVLGAVAGDLPFGIFFTAGPPLALGILMKATPLVRLGPDRIEVKAGVFAAKQIVALAEIRRVIAGSRFMVLETPRGEIRIPAFALHEYESREILDALGGPG